MNQKCQNIIIPFENRRASSEHVVSEDCETGESLEIPRKALLSKQTNRKDNKNPELFRLCAV